MSNNDKQNAAVPPAVPDVQALVNEYIRRVEAGERLPRRRFLRQYPEITIDLAQALTADPRVPELEYKYGLDDDSPPDDLAQPSDREVLSRTTAAQSLFGQGGGSITTEGIVVDQYEVIGEIGRGAMGCVYRARDKEKDRIVALKTLQAGLQISDTQIKRLNREAVAQAKLNHPNIVKVYDQGKIDFVPYIVMEFIEGGNSLESMIAALGGGAFEERVAARIILAVARALAYSHNLDVVHRDIKPANVMMAGDIPKITDFGLAFDRDVDVTRLTQSGEILGTLLYMAPEAVEGRSSSPDAGPKAQSDIYSVGSMFYEMLTGHPPLLGSTPAEMIKKIIETDPTEPAQHGVKLSKDIEAICIKCLEKSLDKRYFSMSELADDLERFLDGRKVMAPRIYWPLRRLRQGADKRQMILLLGFLAILFLGGAIWMAQQYSYREKTTALVESGGIVPPSGKDYNLSFLLKAVTSSEVDIRNAAITALCRHSDEQAGAALLKAAGDPESKVRLHLATAARRGRPAVAGKICEILLRDGKSLIVIESILLAADLDDRRFRPQIETFAYSSEKIIRSYALNTTLQLLGHENHDFVVEYLSRGPADGRMTLLNRFLNGAAPPAMQALIEFLGRAQTDGEKAMIGRILVNFADQRFGPNQEQWQQWWQEHRETWRAALLLVITWAHRESELKADDIVWRIDGQDLSMQSVPALSQNRVTVQVIRGETAILIDGPLGLYRYRPMYIGRRNGVPVGDNSVASRLQAAIAGPLPPAPTSAEP